MPILGSFPDSPLFVGGYTYCGSPSPPPLVEEQPSLPTPPHSPAPLRSRTQIQSEKAISSLASAYISPPPSPTVTDTDAATTMHPLHPDMQRTGNQSDIAMLAPKPLESESPIKPTIRPSFKATAIFSFSLAYTQLSYKVMTLWNKIRGKAEITWWNKMSLPLSEQPNASTPMIVIGGLPLKTGSFGQTFNHAQKLTDLGIKRVLCATNSFETSYQGTLATTPTAEEIKKQGISQEQLDIEDFKPVPLAEIEKGVEFIRKCLNAGESIYVHCNTN